jgi:hypothetical protein
MCSAIAAQVPAQSSQNAFTPHTSQALVATCMQKHGGIVFTRCLQIGRCVLASNFMQFASQYRTDLHRPHRFIPVPDLWHAAHTCGPEVIGDAAWSLCLIIV